MYVLTKEAAKLLNISYPRFHQLLQKGRVKGAYKSGRYWLIPLYNGLPHIMEGKRGRKGTWNTKRLPKKTVIHINGQRLRDNIKKSPEDREPVIAVKQHNNNFYASALEIPYPCRIIYQPDRPLNSCGGARLWIEVLGEDLAAMQPLENIVRRKN